jgi:hypothetical protein
MVEAARGTELALARLEVVRTLLLTWAHRICPLQLERLLYSFWRMVEPAKTHPSAHHKAASHQPTTQHTRHHTSRHVLRRAHSLAGGLELAGACLQEEAALLLTRPPRVLLSIENNGPGHARLAAHLHGRPNPSWSTHRAV